MRVNVRLLSIDPPAFFGGAERAAVEVAAEATVDDLVRNLGLAGSPEAVMTILNDRALPASERAARRLAEGDSLVFFPPIEGG